MDGGSSGSTPLARRTHIPVRQPGELSGQSERKRVGGAALRPRSCEGSRGLTLVMIDITGLVRCMDGAGISTSSPAAEVKRTANVSPYMAVARPLLRDVIPSRLTKFLQIIFCPCLL